MSLACIASRRAILRSFSSSGRSVSAFATVSTSASSSFSLRESGVNLNVNAHSQRVQVFPYFHVADGRRTFSSAAKKRDKKKKKKGEGGRGKAPKKELSTADEPERGMVLDLDTPRSRMGGALTRLKESLGSLQRPGRADASAVEMIEVVSPDGRNNKTTSPLSTFAQISAKNAQTLLVDVLDEAYVKNVVKAISDADTGMGVDVKGLRIALNMPKATREQRERVCDSASNFADAAKSTINKVRQDSVNSIKKSKGVSKDQLHRLQAEVDKMSEGAKTIAEKLLEEKKAEIMKA